MSLVTHQIVGVALQADTLEQLSEQIEKSFGGAISHGDIRPGGAAIHSTILPSPNSSHSGRTIAERSNKTKDLTPRD